MSTQPLVLVSGATGFLASHVINILLRANYRVRGTVRSLKNEEKNKHIKDICPEKKNNPELVEADLLDNNCWKKIIPGCDYVIHTASPFPNTFPKDPNELIKPAVDGTEAIMKTAIENKIKKIVLTSSIASISTGQKENYYTSKDWSNPDNSPPYECSKHLAEKKAWEIYNINKSQQPNDYTKFTVICPSLIVGPTFTNYASTSGELVTKLLKNEMPALAKVSFGYVDVREVAQAHVNALNVEKSDGERYILSEGSYWLEDTANILREEFGQYGYNIPSRTMGVTMLNVAACFDQTARMMKPYAGRMIVYDNIPSRKELGIFYRPVRETLFDNVYSFIDKGLLPNLIDKKQK